MRNNIQNLITFFSTANRCKGSYERNGRYCLLGAMGDKLSVFDNRHLKEYLVSKLEGFVIQFNNRGVNKIDIDKQKTAQVNLNLATFNDNVDDKTLIEFLTYCRNMVQ